MKSSSGLSESDYLTHRVGGFLIGLEVNKAILLFSFTAFSFINIIPRFSEQLLNIFLVSRQAFPWRSNPKKITQMADSRDSIRGLAARQARAYSEQSTQTSRDSILGLLHIVCTLIASMYYTRLLLEL